MIQEAPHKLKQDQSEREVNLIFIKVLVNEDYVYMHQLQISVCKM